MSGDAGVWCRHTDTSGPQHIWPVNDLIHHEVETDADDCPCGPTTFGRRQSDGNVEWTIEHHSLDGRELDE